MWRPSLIALVVLLAAPASADAASRRLLVNGDSLAVGTKPYIPRELKGWKVKQSTAVSRHAYEGADVMRSYGASLAPVVHVSLGTNDDPHQVEVFRVAGTSYDGYNRALAREARAREPADGELGADGAPQSRLAGGRRRARVSRGLPDPGQGRCPAGTALHQLSEGSAGMVESSR
jgi:hypothetical protein